MTPHRYIDITPGDWIHVQYKKEDYPLLFYVTERAASHLVCRSPRSCYSQFFVIEVATVSRIEVVGKSRNNFWFKWFKWTDMVHPWIMVPVESEPYIPKCKKCLPTWS